MSGPEASVLLCDARGVQVYHADHGQLAEIVPSCDAVIVDAPYSARTHRGHNNSVQTDERAHAWAANSNRIDKRTGKSCADTDRRDADRAASGRRRINYAPWGLSEVCEFVELWSPRCRGWIVSITDHVLAPAWATALEAAGRYVFSPLAYVAPGSRVRMVCDGPAQWACWIVVARPRNEEFASWGALPGAYVLPPGEGGAGRLDVVGGKPEWLMRQLVQDYSRPGDLVVDPCCGAGSTLSGALTAVTDSALAPRRAIGGDLLQEHAELAAARVRGAMPLRLRGGTMALFGSGTS